MPKKELEKDVFPGERLAVIEEFIDGPGTYLEEGEIRAAEIGKTKLDTDKRELFIKKATRELVIPRKDDEVYAEIGHVARKDAWIDIFMINGKHIHPTFSGVIHISDISKDYVKNIDIAIKNGDIVRGKIVNEVNRLNQTGLKGNNYGVIYAYCSRCGGILEKQQGKLICPDCGRYERRKTASDYGKVDLL